MAEIITALAEIITCLRDPLWVYEVPVRQLVEKRLTDLSHLRGSGVALAASMLLSVWSQLLIPLPLFHNCWDSSPTPAYSARYIHFLSGRSSPTLLPHWLDAEGYSRMAWRRLFNPTPPLLLRNHRLFTRVLTSTVEILASPL